MGKLLIDLEKQLKTEYREDAENCLIIYNKLKDMNQGHVWSSSWTPLVNTIFKPYPSNSRIFEPTDIGKIFLKGFINVNNFN